MEKQLTANGYYATPEVAHGCRMLMVARDHGIPAVALLTGPPGAGKTALGEALAAAIHARHMYHMCHAWSDADELFVGIHVPAAVAGQAEHVERPGVLAQAAQASQDGDVVLVLDELDKSPEHVEALLLDWLQAGRVQLGPCRHITTNWSNLIVLITSNGVRQHSPALISRCRRMHISPVPTAIAADIVAQRYGWPGRLVRAIAKAGEYIRQYDSAGATPVVIRELARAAAEIMHAASAEDVGCSLMACFGPASPADWPVFRASPDVLAKIKSIAANIYSILLAARGVRT